VTLPLRARLAASFTSLVALLLALLSVVSYRTFARQLDADATTRVTELSKGLHGYVRLDGDVPVIRVDPDDADQAAFVSEATRYYQVYDADTGTLVVQSAAMQPLGLRFTAAEVRTLREQPRAFDISTAYGRLRIVNSLVPNASGGRDLLQVGLSLAPLDTALSRYVALLAWRMPMALILAALSSWWMAGIALSPLGRFARAAKRIEISSLSERLPVRDTHDELDAVAHAFNETLARLEHAIGEMRQFSAALAHELRTPLAALRGEIEMTLRAAPPGDPQRLRFGSQLEEIDKLNRLIDQILTLARAESGQIRLTFAPVDLDRLGGSIVEQLEPIAQARDIDLRMLSSDRVVIDGDPGWLQRLMLNLLDNALKFTSPGGRVTLGVSRHGDDARLEVSDTGAGISADAIRHVFEPFFRADPARTSTPDGAGLGLSLVKWIVDGHRGRVAVRSSAGEGSTFTVWLPQAQPRQASRDILATHDPELIPRSRRSHLDRLQ
jgi:heavy metal sensor kinase